MTDLTRIAAAAAPAGLGVVGTCATVESDGLPGQIRTLVLLGPAGPEMWAAFSASPEAADGETHPMDRWSRRVIGTLAGQLGAVAFFPFGGPPWHPFQNWAARAEGAVASPVAMQATPKRGLWASYRGALGFRQLLEAPRQGGSGPCAACHAPCTGACPVDAFRDGTYDVPRCVAHVRGPEGVACRAGCLVRRACPVGVALELPEAQRRFHMAAFLAAQP